MPRSYPTTASVWRWSHLVLLGLTGVFVWSAWKSPALNEALCHEGQLIELLTVLALGSAAVLFATAERSRWSTGELWRWGLVVLCGVVAAEEISWGQSYFAWSTPEAVARLNVQDETNLHNLAGLQGGVRAVAAACVVGIVLVVPHVARRWKWLGRRLAGLLAPPSVATTALLGLLVMLLTRVVAGGPVFELDEWGECLVSFAFLEYGLVVNEEVRSAECGVRNRGSAVVPGAN